MLQLTRQLRRWQSREFFYRLAWGVARWTAIVLGALALCCFTDWIIDRSVDTPFWLRALMALSQIVLAAGLAWYLIFKLQVPHIDVLAGQAESTIREFDHRLVTALQLNRPKAQTEGMSPQLIDAVTREAESLSARYNLPNLADASRVERAAMLFIPAVLIFAAFVLLRPTLSTALLKRQALLDVPIPRSVAIENVTPKLQPAGDAVRLKFEVKGDFREDSVGKVTCEPDGQPAEKYELKFDSKLDADTAIFIAELPAASTPFSFTARLEDGRTRSPGRVEFAPRPVVTEVSAWLVLPRYVDPKGKIRYERYQPQGEVTALPESGLHVEAALSKPVVKADLVFYGRPDGKNESELQRVPMELDDKNAAGAIEQLPAGIVAYRIQVVDEHGFTNLNPPRRGIANANYKFPTVKLLPEVLKDPKEPGPLEDFAVDGMPLALGGRVQIGYHARSPLGIERVYIWYRVNPTDREKDPWTPLPMKEAVSDEKNGRFVPELGVFETSGPFGQVEFFPFPSVNLAAEPPGIEAGGRFNFETAALTKTLPNGAIAKLDVGDQVEFLVAAYDRRPDPSRLPGESQSRIKAVVTPAQLDDWLGQLAQSQGRLEELFTKQRRVFQGEKDKKRPGKP